MGHMNAKYAAKVSNHYIVKVKGRKCRNSNLPGFCTFSSPSGCLKLQLGVSSISLQVGCEPLVPLGLQNTKPCIQDVLVYYHKIWTCVGTAITFVLLTKEVYNTPMWRTGTGRLLAINRAKPLHFWDFSIQARVLPPKSWVSYFLKGKQILQYYFQVLVLVRELLQKSCVCNVCLCMASKKWINSNWPYLSRSCSRCTKCIYIDNT